MTTRENVPPNADACLLLADGTAFYGTGFGADVITYGELCFHTGMTGYQETLTDPSFAGQIITFTFPHIGNVGCNAEDIEAKKPYCAGLIVREPPTLPSNFRAETSLDTWLKANGIPGLYGVDTRALTRHIREHGAQNGVIFRCQASGAGCQKEVEEKLRQWPNMAGLDLAKQVTTPKTYKWSEKLWRLTPDTQHPAPRFHVVAIDYGEKLNILRCLTEYGCNVTVVPGTYTAEQILALKPDGVFLSNGPGDPAATAQHAAPTLRAIIDTGLPVFGICLGHQLLALALGGRTEKMRQGHRGANQPVKNLQTGLVEITSQNHGFCVVPESLPNNCELTHISLFDGTVEGFRCIDKPVFAVQYHPESSPGPHDSRYLFEQFVGMMEKASGVGLRVSGRI